MRAINKHCECERCNSRSIVPEHEVLDGRKYRLHHGSKPFRLTGHCRKCGAFQCTYVSSGIVIWRYAEEFVLYHGEAEALETAEQFFGNNEGEKEMSKQLFKFKVDENEVYGFKLAVNSKGNWVMEAKATGEIFEISGKDAEEVLPYTVNVSFKGVGGVYAFFAREGDFKVGDVILSDNYEDIMVVKGVNTRNKNATKWLTGLVLHGERRDFVGE